VIQDVFAGVTELLVNGTPQMQQGVKETMGAYGGMDNGDFAFFFADIFVESV